MPAEFQRAMNSILNEFPQANAFIEDIFSYNHFGYNQGNWSGTHILDWKDS